MPTPINVPVRFFIYDYDIEYNTINEEDPIRECTEAEFLEAAGKIEYERHTVFANGVSQICLTKYKD